MRKALFLSIICLLVWIGSFSQDLILGKFLGGITNMRLIGTSRYKLYEKQVEMVELNTSGQSRSTTLSFKFNPCAASADFMAHAQTGTLMSKGDITILEKPNATVGINLIKYKVYFEDAVVVSCNDTQACNNTMATTVVLKPQRICWVYYNYDGNGKATTTSNGYDLKSGQSWVVAIPNF